MKSIEDVHGSGRSITGFTLTNIKLVESLIIENPRISYDILEEQTRLCFGTLNNITTKHLDMTKKENRWVLHFFSNENKKKRLDFANQMLHKSDYGKWRISEILTADEFIFYLSKIDKKR